MRVGTVQINMDLTWANPRRREDESPVSFALLPYSIGTLQAYAERHAADRHQFLLPIHNRLPVEEAVARLRDAELVAFSLYVWNVRLSMAIARQLKRERPEVTIVVGGPQVPDRAEAFLRANPWVDLAVHGEGEATFTALLDQMAAPGFTGVGDLEDVRGCSFLREDGSYERHADAPRIRDLTEIPSPYLEGAFDPLMESLPDQSWVMMWETNRGCPFSCTFCDWGSATSSKVFRFEMERIEAEIEWMSARRIGFVFCCDANFGMLKRDLDIARGVVAARQRHGYPFSLTVQNTKNATERAYEIQKLLSRSMNAIGVTLSLQSTNETTLANIRRKNISSEHYRELQRRFSTDGIYTYTDIILGLPGESYEAFADGIAQVIADGQHNHVQFHNCSLLPNAEMAQPCDVERFGIQTVAQVVRNAHDSADLEFEVEEYLDLVVATDAMPPASWRRAKVFAWLADLLYFDRLLQLPLAFLAKRHDVGLRAAIEQLAASSRPTISATMAMLADHAAAIQAGGPEFIAAPQWGNMIWPADQYALIGLVVERRLSDFYAEAADELAALLGDEDEELALRETVGLNMAMLRMPMAPRDQPLAFSHPVLEHHRALLVGEDAPMQERLSTYVVRRSRAYYPTFAAWLEHLVWCHGKDKRGYLYDVDCIATPTPVAA